MVKDLAGRMTAAQLGVGVVADSDTPAKLLEASYDLALERALYGALKA